jgi:NitT/TauT family transport system ATP-binding protein
MGPGMTLENATTQRTAEFDLQAISHTFPTTDKPAVVDIDLEVQRGEIVALIGPSGCGKSTVLNMLAGLLIPSEGSVVQRGQALTQPVSSTGLMFQKPALLPWRTTVENILLPLEVRGGKRQAKEHRQRALDLVSKVGLTGFEHAYPWQLSGGMAQRAAICRMLVSEPDVLLLDEPFGALDEFTRERMDQEIQTVAASRNATVVLVTHSIPEAVFLADRVVAMAAKPGRIIDTIPINLPRPRTLEHMGSPDFAAHVHQVREALNRGHHE